MFEAANHIADAHNLKTSGFKIGNDFLVWKVIDIPFCTSESEQKSKIKKYILKIKITETENVLI